MIFLVNLQKCATIMSNVGPFHPPKRNFQPICSPSTFPPAAPSNHCCRLDLSLLTMGYGTNVQPCLIRDGKSAPEIKTSVFYPSISLPKFRSSVLSFRLKKCCFFFFPTPFSECFQPTKPAHFPSFKSVIAPIQTGDLVAA